MAMVVFRIESCVQLNPTKLACKVRIVSLINIYSGLLTTNVRLLTVIITRTLVIFLLCSPSVVVLLKRLQLTSIVTGPESLAFDLNGEGPYMLVLLMEEFLNMLMKVSLNMLQLHQTGKYINHIH
jgi:hypothetical protein